LKKNIPNTITCANLFCGCLALVKAFQGDLEWTAYLVGIAAVLDFLDGFAARMLNAYSVIGKDLDSLADMVTFGVVPGVVMFKLITLSRLIGDAQAHGVYDTAALAYEDTVYSPAYIGFAITIFSAIRLAKFNNDSRQSDSFIGLPTPANTILICSLPLVLAHNKEMALWFMNPSFLCILSCVTSLLLVSEIPLFSLKFKSFGWSVNSLRYIFLLLSLLLIFTTHFIGITLIVILYILLSIVNNIFSKKKV
jgi:CDP-diacylglycerol--serine O-phosphatidyltransferase